MNAYKVSGYYGTREGWSPKEPQGTFRSKNAAASRGGPNALHHTVKPMHLVCLTLVKNIFQSEELCALSAAGLGEGHSPQLKELRFVSQHGKTLYYGYLLVSGPLSAEGSTTHQRCYECRLAHSLCLWRRKAGTVAQLSVFRAGLCRAEDFARGRWDMTRCLFPGGFSSLTSFSWPGSSACPPGCQMDACFSCSLFPSPGVACCLSSSQDWWVRLESLEPVLVTKG